MYQIKFLTSSLARFCLVTAFAGIISSCGFTPLYESRERDGSRMCSNFTVSKIRSYDVSGQKLQYSLQDLLNQACIDSDVNYTVDLAITKAKEAVAIQKDREVTRYNLIYNVKFNVVDKATGKSVYSSNSNIVGGFDAVISDYGTYSLEKDTERKLFEEMANDIALKISSTLLRKK